MLEVQAVSGQIHRSRSRLLRLRLVFEREQEHVLHLNLVYQLLKQLILELFIEPSISAVVI